MTSRITGGYPPSGGCMVWLIHTLIRQNSSLSRNNIILSEINLKNKCYDRGMAPYQGSDPDPSYNLCGSRSCIGMTESYSGSGIRIFSWNRNRSRINHGSGSGMSWEVGSGQYQTGSETLDLGNRKVQLSFCIGGLSFKPYHICGRRLHRIHPVGFAKWKHSAINNF